MLTDTKSAGGRESRFTPKRTFGRPRAVTSTPGPSKRSSWARVKSSAARWGDGILSAAVIGVALAIFVFVAYRYSFPGSQREVAGSILMFENVGSDDGPTRRRLIVKLDNGYTVRAGFPGHLVARVGRRARLIEATSPFFGMKSYRFNGFDDGDETMFIKPAD